MNKLVLSLDSIFDLTDSLKIDVTIEKALIVIGVALLLALCLSFIYIFTHKKTGYSSSMPTTLIVLPIVIAAVIMLVGTNYASAFALAGVFTLIRFRSEPGDPKDISYIFSSVAVGLCCGMGFIYVAIFICALLSLILTVVYLTRFGEAKKTNLKLKILIPEDLNYSNVFDDIFAKHGVKASLDKVKTVDFGTMFELLYRIDVNADFNQKAFIDDLRTRNGNLNIVLTLNDNYYTRTN